jgi:hypothetical protein
MSPLDRWQAFATTDPEAAHAALRQGYAMAASDLMDPADESKDPWAALTKWLDDGTWGTH